MSPVELVVTATITISLALGPAGVSIAPGFVEVYSPNRTVALALVAGEGCDDGGWKPWMMRCGIGLSESDERAVAVITATYNCAHRPNVLVIKADDSIIPHELRCWQRMFLPLVAR